MKFLNEDVYRSVPAQRICDPFLGGFYFEGLHEYDRFYADRFYALNLSPNPTAQEICKNLIGYIP